MATGEVRSKSADPEPILTQAGNPPLPLYLPKGVRLRVSPAMFWRLCCENRDLRLERTATGRLIVMAPAGGESSGANFTLSGQLYVWCRANGTGKGFDSSFGFILPNGAIVGPDAAWILWERWNAVPADQRKRLPAICPDFVVELRSPSDRIGKLRAKMRQYVAQGVRLGWLLDPSKVTAEVYRPGREAEVLERPATLSGEDVLPGFVLDLRGILFD